MIRDARPADVDAIARLLGELGYPSSSDEVKRRVALLTASDADRCVVAELNGEIVGLATIHASLSIVDDGPAAKLSAIVVDKGHRRRGIGHALVSELEAEARTRGCSVLFLTTAERREDAHDFYRRLGFTETGRRFAKSLD